MHIKKKTFILLLIAFILIITRNVSNAESIDLSKYLYGKGNTDDTFYEKESSEKLHEYYNGGDVSDSNKKKCDAIATKDKAYFLGSVGEVVSFGLWDSDVRFGIRYNWLHATQKLIDDIKSINYISIANNNDKKNIKKTIDALTEARTHLGSFIGDSAEITHETSTQFLHLCFLGWEYGADYDRSEVQFDDIRSANAFQIITDLEFPLEMNSGIWELGEENSYVKECMKAFSTYDKKLCNVLQKLRTAYDYACQKGTCDVVDIYINDDYKSKFTYKIDQIKYYDIWYSMSRLGENLSDIEKKQIKNCWGAKVAAEDAGYSNVATRTDLYVRKKDTYATKMSYDADEAWLYLQIFGLDFGEVNKTQEAILAVEWANLLKNGEHTSFFNKNTSVSSTSGNKSFNGATNANYESSEIGTAMGYLNGIDNVVQKGLDIIAKSSNAWIDNTNTYTMDALTLGHAAYEDWQERTNDNEEKHDPDASVVFKQPRRVSDKNEDGSEKIVDTVNDAISDAESFVTSGDSNGIVSEGNLQIFSQNLYSTLLAIGVVVSVIIGVILGVKLMLAPIQERAEAKKLLIPYTIGCVIVFGAFGIWKLIVTIMQGM